MKKKFDFEDITLIPKYSVVESRSECDVTTKFGGFKFKLPVVPANMESIIDTSLAIKLVREGYFYILHRFGTDVVEFVTVMKEMGLMTSISIGVNEDSYTLIDELISKNLFPDFITIDIAHGHSIKMKKMVTHLRKKMMNTFIIGGNVSTPEGVIDLEKWGCDSVKCGIGGGSACTTYHSTGFGNRGWQANIIKDCCEVAKKPIIADGSIKEHSDIVKSLVLGADMVMVGGMFAGYEESPGKLKQVDNVWYKTFWGSASSEQTGKNERVEGIKKLVPFKQESIFVKLKSIEESLQSAISYGGGNPSKLKSLLSVDYVIVK